VSDHEDDRFDGEPSFDEPSFDDPAYDELRSLLADTRVTEPAPPDVAARLDATLASLRERSRPETVVVPLRRKLAPRLAAAAAAVIVLGVGGVAINQISRTGSSDYSRSTADKAAGGSADSLSPAAPERASGDSPHALLTRPTLRTAHFAADAARLMRRVQADMVPGSEFSAESPAPSTPSPSGTLDSTDTSSGRRPEAPPVTATPELSALASKAADCTAPTGTPGVALAATLDGAPVTLLFRAPTATGQLVEAWSCDGTTLLASATIPD
jgi:hypothetical protein